MTERSIKRIFFLRSAEYDYHAGGSSLYKSFDEIGKGTIDPQIASNAKEQFQQNLPTVALSAKEVYSAPSRRCTETAQLLTPSPIVLPQLKDIGYEMGNFITEEEFYDAEGKPNVGKARVGLAHAIVEDRINEPYQDIMGRVQDLFHLFDASAENSMVAFTHGFLLAIIEGFVQDTSIAQTPDKLLHYFDGSRESYKFLEGFEAEIHPGHTLKLGRHIQRDKKS